MNKQELLSSIDTMLLQLAAARDSIFNENDIDAASISLAQAKTIMDRVDTDFQVNDCLTLIMYTREMKRGIPK